MQIAVRPVEDGEVGLRRKIFEEIEQCQSENVYAIFEHIDVVNVAGRRRTVCR